MTTISVRTDGAETPLPGTSAPAREGTAGDGRRTEAVVTGRLPSPNQQDPRPACTSRGEGMNPAPRKPGTASDPQRGRAGLALGDGSNTAGTDGPLLPSPLDLPDAPPTDDPAEELAITRTETVTAARVSVGAATRLVRRLQDRPEIAGDPNVYVGLWELAEAAHAAIYTADVFATARQEGQGWDKGAGQGTDQGQPGNNPASHPALEGSPTPTGESE